MSTGRPPAELPRRRVEAARRADTTAGAGAGGQTNAAPAAAPNAVARHGAPAAAAAGQLAARGNDLRHTHPQHTVGSTSDGETC